ncbi:GntR family transcriptional regulator [Alicyclobacillus dauci]|uniref:GntR family transcriptional regulator n=1 Tax=Alicyclobacillus dauci TaxID=1475485 RepID=A0ABY6Z1Z1_9BACL|nr:GntR family transcriptional regulator [Alicyclobacillus dauci]WAH36528.1 GntR family transcriptional regulator [Alicyclobacillus dauci]
MATQRRTTAKERAYQYLKACIIDETFKQDSFLTEEEVAQNLGISRTPVREAFLLLEAEGFVNLFPQRGAYIPTISIRDMQEVMETRELIELFSIDRLMANVDAVRGMKQLIQEQEQLLEEGDIQQFIDCDSEFHNAIVSASGNHLLMEIYSGLNDKMLRMGVKAVMSSSERMRQVILEHQAILRAVEAGEEIRLRAAIISHLETTLSVLLKHKV